MRLINVRTRQFEEFWNETQVEYAIFSHRWEDGEVDYNDFLASTVREKKGHAKIELACSQALHDGLDYLWIDTCCINKDSSAELTDAINSMYRWYQKSSVCYVFLSDVKYDQLNASGCGSLAASAWFARGWTLQELLAPTAVVFYDQAWEFLGTKESLETSLSKITGIDSAIFGGESVSTRSVAQRMSWASHRRTTRVEDTAYCLLGIFDIYMPIIYGEGSNAFVRLQEEIIRQYDDQSIFAWAQQDGDEHGLLAPSPHVFAPCRYIKTLPSRKGRAAFSVTNRGVQLNLDAVCWSVDTYLVKLDCVDELSQTINTPANQYRMGMFLRRLDEDDQFMRVQHANQTFIQLPESHWETKKTVGGQITSQCQKLDIKVRRHQNQHEGTTTVAGRKDRVNGFRLTSTELLERHSDGTERFAIQAQGWNQEAAIMSTPPGRSGTVGQLDISAQNRKIKTIKLGFDYNFNPVIFIAESSGLMRPSLPELNSTYGYSSTHMAIDADERVQTQSISERSCFDEHGWSKISTDSLAAQLQLHPGLWALKGDRLHGLACRLADAEGSTTSVTIKRGEFGDRLVWDVHITGMKDSFLRRMNVPNPTSLVSGGHKSLVDTTTSKSRKPSTDAIVNTPHEAETPTKKEKEKEKEKEEDKDKDRDTAPTQVKSAFQRFKSNW